MKKEEFELLLNASSETEHIEFKEAKESFNIDVGDHSICGYCIALANEGGGKLVLGVSDRVPRQVKGTNFFSKDPQKLANLIFDRIHRRVDIEEFFYNNKRVLIFHIPPRPIGEPLEYKGQYLMRIGDSLRPMTPEQYKKISQEAIRDYSSNIVSQATLEDLSSSNISELRRLLLQSNRIEKKDISSLNDKQLLIDLGLIVDNKITVAALILLGEERNLKRFLPHAEVRFGYKINEEEIRNQDAYIFSGGYLSYYNKLWDKINSRNLNLNLPLGIRILGKKQFEEETIREALNNAIIHRDYTESETIFITQTPNTLAISSPGGLLSGITTKNIADETKTRNKLLADVLYKCGFVEQFGNGVNLMIKNQLSSGKSFPDYSRTDPHHVILKLDGTIQDLEFAKYVFLVAQKKNKILNDQELIILNKIRNNQRVESNKVTTSLLDLELIEWARKGKYVLSRQYYQDFNKKGEYTRRKGLDKEAKKALIIKHLKEWKKGIMQEFVDALPGVPRSTINLYLQELRSENKIELIGNPQIVRGENMAYWQLRSRNSKLTV